MFSFIFASFLSSPLSLSLLSNAESHDSANPLPLPPHILRYCYDIMMAVAGGGCHGNRVMIGGAVRCQEACWGSWMGGWGGVTRVGWCDFSLLGDGGGQLGGRGPGGGRFTMNFGVFVDGKRGGGG